MRNQERKTELQEKVYRRICVRDITFLTPRSHFVAFFVYSPYPSEVLVEWPLQRQMFCYVWYSVWWYHALTVENMKISYNLIFYVFFYKHCFFPTRPRCSLAFLWIELEMLLRCYLIHMIIIIHSIFYV